MIRFAEPDGSFEKSPGYLDSLSLPNAFICLARTNVPVEATKMTNHFLLKNVFATQAICVETVFTVRGAKKPYFYARWQPADSQADHRPTLNLDIVPTGKRGEARVWFRGKPLGEVKATLHSPNGKEEELIADKDGFLRFETAKPGQYLLTIAHYREPLAGFFGGQAYDQTSHNGALSWQEP